MNIKIPISEIKRNDKINFVHSIRVKAPISEEFFEIKNLLKDLNLRTVCEDAACPNIGECWKKKHATFIAMGDVCTRRCRFCNIPNGRPKPLDIEEPLKIAIAVKRLNLNHVVITSVDRDDLEDGGANHFRNIIEQIRLHSEKTTIEVLVPDFLNKQNSIEIVMSAKPDVFNHNIEIPRRIFKKIKLGGNYEHSLKILKIAKEIDRDVFTKSGLIVGTGESNQDIFETMDDLRASNVDFITIGQYLKPKSYDKRYIDIDRFVTNEEFEIFKNEAIKKGFLMVSASALTRSSYHASEDFERLKTMRKQI